MLWKTDLKLDGLLQIARSIEASNLHANSIEAASEPPGQPLNQLISSESQRPNNPWRRNCRKNAKNSGSKRKDTKQGVCFCCGCAGDRARDPSCACTCTNCGKQGHFARVCKSAPKPASKDLSPRSDTQQRNGLRYATTKQEISDDEYLFAVGSNKETTTITVTVGTTLIPVIIDSGASVNVLMDNGFILRNWIVKIYPYGSETPLPVKGMFSANVSMPRLHTRVDFVVVENFNAGPLLGKKTATELGLLRVGTEHLSMVNQIIVGSTQVIVDKHDAVFRGVGKLKDYQLKIHVDPEVTPVAQPQRCVPFHICKYVENKLKELQDLDVIEVVERPMRWVSPLVAVPKSNGDVRVCVDMHELMKLLLESDTRYRHLRKHWWPSTELLCSRNSI